MSENMAAVVDAQTADTFRQQMAARGIPSEQVERTLAAHGVSQAPAQTPTPNPAREQERRIDALREANYRAHKLQPLTAEQAAMAVEGLRRAGVPEDQIQAALAADGYQETPAPETSPAEQAFDESSLGAARSPDDYRLDFTNQPELDTGDLVALDANLRQAFFQGGVPVSHAAPLASAIFEAAEQWGKLEGNPAAQETYKRVNLAALGQFGGADEMFRLAAISLGRMPQEFQDMADRDGALKSAQVIVRLAQIGRLLEHRAGLAKARGK